MKKDGAAPSDPRAQAPTQVKAAALDLIDGTHSRLSEVTGLGRLKGDHIPKLHFISPSPSLSNPLLDLLPSSSLETGWNLLSLFEPLLRGDGETGLPGPLETKSAAVLARR